MRTITISEKDAEQLARAAARLRSVRTTLDTRTQNALRVIFKIQRRIDQAMPHNDIAQGVQRDRRTQHHVLVAHERESSIV